MSHSVTITRTTVASSGTPLFINSNYLCTTPGLLKLGELLLGAVCVGVIAYYVNDKHFHDKSELFFLLAAVACLVGTFCILTACIVSLSTASLISKTVYEVIYHGIAFVLYLSAGITLLVEVNHRNNSYRSEYEAYLAAAIMGLVNAALYLLSTFLASRQYRGI